MKVQECKKNKFINLEKIQAFILEKKTNIKKIYIPEEKQIT